MNSKQIADLDLASQLDRLKSALFSAINYYTPNQSHHPYHGLPSAVRLVEEAYSKAVVKSGKGQILADLHDELREDFVTSDPDLFFASTLRSISASLEEICRHQPDQYTSNLLATANELQMALSGCLSIMDLRGTAVFKKWSENYPTQ